MRINPEGDMRARPITVPVFVLDGPTLTRQTESAPPYELYFNPEGDMRARSITVPVFVRPTLNRQTESGLRALTLKVTCGLLQSQFQCLFSN